MPSKNPLPGPGAPEKTYILTIGSASTSLDEGSVILQHTCAFDMGGCIIRVKMKMRNLVLWEASWALFFHIIFKPCNFISWEVLHCKPIILLVSVDTRTVDKVPLSMIEATSLKFKDIAIVVCNSVYIFRVTGTQIRQNMNHGLPLA